MMAQKLFQDCCVRLDRVEFSKIRIGCTANNEDGDAIKCHIKQTGSDSFDIRMGMIRQFKLIFN